MNKPTCTIIAGPNGAGKTTFALKYLPQINCSIFLNADMIAAGLAPFSAERKQLEAGKLFLQEIERSQKRKEDFAFETTLSGKSHLSRVRRMPAEGWRVNLIYLWLPGVEASLSRVRERVLQGGHNIPENDIRRRYGKSLKNLLAHYAPLCTETECFDNSARPRRLIFRQAGTDVIVANNELFDAIRGQAGMGEQTVVKEQREVYGLDGIVYELPAKRNAADVDAEFIGQVLDYAVARELERKRRLGFDAIIVENNMIMKLHPDGSMTEVGPVE
ncbi:MAG: zeta toxin family protein [Gammaproteobacteria bacterium]|nr:zeta toxin family protein [Gammaproteobacteria bacterium]